MYSNRCTVYCCWDSGKHGHFLIKLNTHFPYDPVSQSQVLALPRVMNTHSHKNLYADVSNSSSQNHQKLNTTQMSCSSWMDKQCAVHPYNRILFKNKMLINTTYWINLKGSMLSEIRQSQKVNYCMILFVILSKCYIYCDREETSDCQSLRIGGRCDYKG